MPRSLVDFFEASPYEVFANNGGFAISKKRRRGIAGSLIGVFSSSVSSRQGVLEQAKLGCGKGEDGEKQGDRTKRGKCPSWRFAAQSVGLKELCLYPIRDRRGKKEDGNVEPVGGLADHAVVGVEDDRDQAHSQKDAAPLHAPEIPTVAEEKALHDGKEKGRPKEELHVLSGGFVHARAGGDPCRL